jgi:rod shape-determining protein MreC
MYSASFAIRTFVSDFADSLSSNAALREENEQLRQQIDEQRLLTRMYQQQLEDANRILATTLAFPHIHQYSLVPARVLAYLPEDFFKVLFINKGYEHGVRRDTAIVNTQGLVGKTVEIYPRSSKVLLITDERTKMGVRIEQTQDLGVLRGTGKPRVCELDYVLTNSQVSEGDEVMTSGLGGILPAGIMVGRVSHVDARPNYVFQGIQVEPAVDFGRVDKLFILAVEE